jgi:hypothetical protein
MQIVEAEENVTKHNAEKRGGGKYYNTQYKYEWRRKI